MNQTCLLINTITDDRMPVSSGVIALGSFSNVNVSAEELSWLEPDHASVMMNDDPECDLWLQVPESVAAIGCAAPNASTIWMLFDARDRESVLLTDIILKLKFIRFSTWCWERLEKRRSSLGPPNSIRMPAWLMHGIMTVSNKLEGGQAERIAVAAGLHLLYDDLDGSHSLSQTIEGRGKNRNGDYWHAIMHRREPDYNNAKYWFRRVGAHPVLAELPAVLERIRVEAKSAELDHWRDRLVRNGTWDPFAFIDACEAAAEHPPDSEFRRALEEIQHFEMLHLLVQSCADAHG